MKRFGQLVGMLVLVAACGAAGLWGTQYLLVRAQDGEEEDGQRPQAVRVTVTAPEPREVADSVSAIGTVYPQRSIELRPLAAGRVEEVFVDSGAEVEAGAPILALDARAARAAVERAEATRDETLQEFRRFTELSDENVAAEARLEEARAAAVRAEADLDAARAALEDRRLTAPFAGTLGIVTTDPGEYVDTSTPITSLDDLTSVEVQFAMPERYFARVSPGQTVNLSTAVYPERDFTGTVSVRAAAIDRASRSFDVRARLDNPQKRLAGGMFVDTEIVFGRDEALTIPDDAVIGEGNTTFVFTVADGAAQRTEIDLGARIGPRIEVTAGLERDDRVIVTGWDDLSDGASVTVAEDAPDEALN